MTGFCFTTAISVYPRDAFVVSKFGRGCKPKAYFSSSKGSAVDRNKTPVVQMIILEPPKA